MGSLAMEAAELVARRDKEYGDPTKSYREVSQILKILDITPDKPEFVPMAIMVHKLVREKYIQKKDNILDAIGYLDIVGKIKGYDKE